ncbi:type II restriction endonuclease [Endozoicomonas sp. 4G]|uniref:type II restriction endonuclease n=1 Tax=Endozoicomonas sp. 4G TaxID=2872754 RepID=UPI002078D2D1|nr:type II restriction endonuclease [Endozoicomonas sp. 4G]
MSGEVVNVGFKDHELKFEQGTPKKVTENKQKPDFLFPSFLCYHDSGFPVAKLRMLGAKSTCKDRWRQVLSEAEKIERKHLVTLEAGISQDQTAEMQAKNLQLVVPASVQTTYTSEQQEWLMSLREFIVEIEALQR